MSRDTFSALIWSYQLINRGGGKASLFVSHNSTPMVCFAETLETKVITDTSNGIREQHRKNTQMDSFKGDSPQETRPIEISEEEMQTLLFRSVFMTRTRAERREMDEKNFIVQFVVKLSNTITTKTKLVIKPIDMFSLIKTVTEKTAGKLPAELPTSINKVVKSVFRGLQKMYNSKDLLRFFIVFRQSTFEENVSTILISETNKVKEKGIKGSVVWENQTSPAETSEEQIPSPGQRTQETKERNFIIQFLVRLNNMVALKTGTATNQVNIFAILENVIEMAVGKLPAQLPKSLGKLVRAVYKSLKKTYKSKLMVQTAMEFRQLNFEDNVARMLISEVNRMKEKRIKVFVVKENNNNSSEQSSSKTTRNCCSFGKFLKTLFPYKIIVEIRL